MLVTYYLKNRTGNCRFGITTSKKIGNAVERNRARRVIKTAFVAVLPDIVSNFDLVFVARSKAVFTKSTEIEKILRKQLCSAGLIKPAATKVERQ